MKYIWILAAFCLPQFAFASVFVSEIAWMGTSVSSSDEWVELCNSGGEVSLSGWKLSSTDSGLSVPLSGTIYANACYLIERTDDATLPDRAAELVASFGAGLSNSGEILQLIDANGQVIDEVDGSSAWKNIGGNSTTKETAQKDGDVWITAVPTPGVLYEGGGFPDETASETASTTGAAMLSSSGNSSYRVGLRDSYKLEVAIDTVVAFGEDTHAVARVIDGNGHSIDHPTVIWNFGDGFISEGLIVSHRYQFLGTYTVHVEMEYRGKKEYIEKRIEVRSGDIRIVDAKEGEDGYVTIEAKMATDISGWQLEAVGLSYTFREHTVLQAKTPLRFPNMYTGIVAHNTLSLKRNDGLILSVFSPAGDSERSIAGVSAPLSSRVVTEKVEGEGKTLGASSSPTMLAYVNKEEQSSIRGGAMKYVGAGLFLLVSLFGVAYLSRVFNPNRALEEEAAKFALVEMESNLDPK